MSPSPWSPSCISEQTSERVAKCSTSARMAHVSDCHTTLSDDTGTRVRLSDCQTVTQNCHIAIDWTNKFLPPSTSSRGRTLSRYQSIVSKSESTGPSFQIESMFGNRMSLSILPKLSFWRVACLQQKKSTRPIFKIRFGQFSCLPPSGLIVYYCCCCCWWWWRWCWCWCWWK